MFEVGVELVAVEAADVVADDEALAERLVDGHGQPAAQFGEADEQGRRRPRRGVAHDEIRFIMDFDLSGVTPDVKAELKQRAATMEVQAEDWLRADDNPDLEVHRLLSQAYGDSSVVGLVPTRSSVTIFVGVLGLYVGLVDAPADTKGFPP